MECSENKLALFLNWSSCPAFRTGRGAMLHCAARSHSRCQPRNTMVNWERMNHKKENYTGNLRLNSAENLQLCTLSFPARHRIWRASRSHDSCCRHLLRRKHQRTSIIHRTSYIIKDKSQNSFSSIIPHTSGQSRSNQFRKREKDRTERENTTSHHVTNTKSL